MTTTQSPVDTEETMTRNTKQTWDEMTRQYPDQWLLIVDFETDECGQVVTGAVTRHGDTMGSISSPPSDGTPAAFLYTGESRFMGIRDHADHNAI